MHILLLRSICKPINFCLRFCRCRKIISPSLFLSSLTLCHWMCVRHKVTQMRFYSVRVFNVIQSPSTKWDDLSQPSNETEAKTISQVNNLWQNPKQVFQQHKFTQKNTANKHSKRHRRRSEQNLNWVNWVSFAFERTMTNTLSKTININWTTYYLKYDRYKFVESTRNNNKTELNYYHLLVVENDKFCARYRLENK